MNTNGQQTTYGNHSPFDSDRCLEWGIFCQNNNHNPDMPATFNEENKGSVLLQDIGTLLSKPTSNG